MHRSCTRINGSIILLSRTNIGHRTIDTLGPRPPYLSTCSIPDQMALIAREHDHGSIRNFCRMGRQLVDDRFFLRQRGRDRAWDGCVAPVYRVSPRPQAVDRNSGVIDRPRQTLSQDTMPFTRRDEVSATLPWRNAG